MPVGDGDGARGLKRAGVRLVTTIVLAVPLVLLVRGISALGPAFASEHEPACTWSSRRSGCVPQILAPESRQSETGVYIVTTAPLEQAADRLAQCLAAAGIIAFLLYLGRYLRAEEKEFARLAPVMMVGLMSAMAGALAALALYNQGKPELWVIPVGALLGFAALWPVLASGDQIR